MEFAPRPRTPELADLRPATQAGGTTVTRARVPVDGYRALAAHPSIRGRIVRSTSARSVTGAGVGGIRLPARPAAGPAGSAGGRVARNRISLWVVLPLPAGSQTRQAVN